MRLIRRFSIRNVRDICGNLQAGFAPDKDYPILGYVQEHGVDLLLVANDWDEFEWIALDRCQFGCVLE